MDEKAVMHAIIKAEGLAGGEGEQHLCVRRHMLSIGGSAAALPSDRSYDFMGLLPVQTTHAPSRQWSVK